MVHLIAQMGGYDFLVMVRDMCREEIEAVISNLKPGENCCVSHDSTHVYNSNMCPLYSNGEKLLAEKDWTGKIDRYFQYIP